MTIRSGVLSGVRVAHDRATVEQIAAASGDSEAAVVESLLAREGVREAFALQTCNRAEAYVVTDDAERGRAVLAEQVDAAPAEVVVHGDHEESLRHLLRVATGLESLVLGEDQVLGQLRTAYETARGAGGIGPVLEEAVTKAIHVGERARNETGINDGIVSLGSAAARLATEAGALERGPALVVGAGEMGTLAARSLADRGAERVLVANRTVPHAEHVAEEVDADAEALGLDAAADALARAALVITATGADGRLFGVADFAEAGETTVVDMAQPRDVDPAVAERASVTMYDLDDLEAVTDRTRRQRADEIDRVEAIVAEEFDHLQEQFKRKRADEVIAAMYESAEHVKNRELSRATAKLEAEGDGELTDEQREILESLADSLVGQLLAAPTESLRDAAAEDDWETIHTALQLFDPEFGGGDGGKPPGMPDEIPDEMPDELPDEIPDDADLPPGAPIDD
jgi:glutamyl-tRNA reductase